MEIYFQKIIDSQTGNIKYYEALSRWVSKDLGFVSPEVFFDMALKTGINDILDRYIIEKTFRIYSIFLDENNISDKTKLAINLSGTTLYI